MKLLTFKEIEQHPQAQYKTNVVIIILLATIVVSFVFLIYGLIGITFNLFDDVLNRFVTLFLIPLTYLSINIWVIQRQWDNKINVLSRVIVMTSFIAIMLATYFTGGLHTTTILGVIVVLAISVLLMDLIATLFLYLLTIAFFFFLFFAEIYGWIPITEQDLPLKIIELIGTVTILILIIAYHRYAIQQSERKVATLEANLKFYNAQQTITQNITHDLKTPLSVLKTIAYIISKKQEKNLPIEKDLKQLDVATNRINLIIESLFELSLLDNETILATRNGVNIKSLLSTSIDAVRDKAEEKNINITIEDKAGDDCRVLGLHTQLIRVFVELLENAIVYNYENGEIHIALKQDEQTFFLSIQDTGIGIAEDKKDQVLDRFFKVDESRTSTEKAGTGIGLTIAKRIIELHTGHITVDSQLGKGTTFTVSLPLMKK